MNASNVFGQFVWGVVWGLFVGLIGVTFLPESMPTSFGVFMLGAVLMCVLYSFGVYTSNGISNWLQGNQRKSLFFWSFWFVLTVVMVISV